MVSLFGFGQPKCEQCGMKLTAEVYEWHTKKFCSKNCKQSFRHKKAKGSGSCH